MPSLETDYLVLGAGASGMAFADELVAHSDADIVIVDRRHAPGGHWNDAYPFVRLHQPSSFYGVSSLPLGSESIDRHGPNQGLYERATGPEVCAYYQRVMEHRLLPSGRVRYYPMCEYTGEHRFVSRLSGTSYDVKVRKALVDGRYLEPSIPATLAPPFEVEAGARVVTPSELPRLEGAADGYVVIGGGKTALDVCSWLLESGVPASDIRWLKPRECWLQNRIFAQGGELVATLLEGAALQMEAAAQADSVADLFARLAASAQLLRVDESVAPTMYKAATISQGEIDSLRRIEGVTRGRVRRVEREQIVLDSGSLPTSTTQVHVHCAAPGLNPATAAPIFAPGRITPQPVRSGLVPFNAALAGFVEASGRELAEKNRLCPPNRLPDEPLDWLRGLLIATSASHAWSQQPDIADWLERTRLNISRGLKARRADPQVQSASQRFSQHVRPGLANLQRLLSVGVKASVS